MTSDGSESHKCRQFLKNKERVKFPKKTAIRRCGIRGAKFLFLSHYGQTANGINRTVSSQETDVTQVLKKISLLLGYARHLTKYLVSLFRWNCKK